MSEANDASNGESQGSEGSVASEPTPPHRAALEIDIESIGKVKRPSSKSQPAAPAPKKVQAKPAKPATAGKSWVPAFLVDWFADPDSSIYFATFMVLSVILFMRWNTSIGGFPFDEQEAILGNPYVRSAKMDWMHAFDRDFWGRLPNATIGSYRPIPNLIWRGLWQAAEHAMHWRDDVMGAIAHWRGLEYTSDTQLTPGNQVFVWFNLFFHATNGALLAALVQRMSKKISLAWLAGFLFVGSAIITEAAAGIVGIADVLLGLAFLAGLWCLYLHPAIIPLGVFVATLLGMLSKETALVFVGLIPLAAWMFAPYFRQAKPWSWGRTLDIVLVGLGVSFLIIAGICIYKSMIAAPLPEGSTYYAPKRWWWVLGLMCGFLAIATPLLIVGKFRHDRDPAARAWLSVLGSGVGALLGFIVYWVIRHYSFFIEFTPNQDALHAGFFSHWHEVVRLYFGMPNFPADDFNNPLSAEGVSFGLRAAGALRVYLHQLFEVFVPLGFAPDYSRFQEDVPNRVWSLTTISGIALLAGPPIAGLALWITRAVRRCWQVRAIAVVALHAAEWPDAFNHASKQLQTKATDSPYALWIAYALIAWPIAYLPVSNIFILLPTVRAERFWYIPMIVIAVMLAIAFLWLIKHHRIFGYALLVPFIGWQFAWAYIHGHHFQNDLVYWQAGAYYAPNSAKEHLNYSVMLGARAHELWGWTETQAQEARVKENLEAVRIDTEHGKKWDMALVYVGDSYCQLGRLAKDATRPKEYAPDKAPHYFDLAVEYYQRGFRWNPSAQGLIALALGCLQGNNELLSHEKPLTDLIEDLPVYSEATRMIEESIRREKICRGVEKPPFLDPELEEALPDGVPVPAESDRKRQSASDFCGVRNQPRGLDGAPDEN